MTTLDIAVLKPKVDVSCEALVTFSKKLNPRREELILLSWDAGCVDFLHIREVLGWQGRPP